MSKISRRQLMGTVAAGAAAATMGGLTVGCAGTRPVKTYQRSDFYTADGKFNDVPAKQAYFDMLERFNCPIYANLRAGLWVLDFGLGLFPEVGMGGIFWVNEKEGDYLGHEIYLLPNQMLVEHWHVKTDMAAKMEAWQLRYGNVTLFGEGEPTVGAEALIPVSQRPYFTAKRAYAPKPGELGKLERPEAKHCMVAGPEGCVVTEYASYHDGQGLRFSNPAAKL